MTGDPAIGPLRDLGDIRKVQGMCLAGLQRLRDFAGQLQLLALQQTIDEAIVHLQDDTFTIAVVGEFKRGKSTFVNALLGRDVLPTDVLPTTATLNRIIYGLSPSVTVEFNDGHNESVDINSLSDYVTKLTAQARDRAATVAQAVVRYPIPFLLNNVEIIDTPGLNDEASMDVITNNVIPHVDAAILVITPQAPFSQYEADFVENKLMASDLARILVVLTRIDSLESPAACDRMITFIEERVRDKILERAAADYGIDSEEYQTHLRKIGVPKVFGVSAKLALDAKLRNNATVLSASRFSAFEAALARFLSEERGPILLQVPLNRVRAAAREVLDAIAAREEVLRATQAGLTTPYETMRIMQEELRREVNAALDRLEVRGPQMAAALHPHLDTLSGLLNSAAESAIDHVTINVAALEQQAVSTTGTQVSQAVANAVGQAARLWLAQVREAGSQLLSEEAGHLGELTQRVAPALGTRSDLQAAPGFALSGLATQLADLAASLASPSAAGSGVPPVPSSPTPAGPVLSAMPGPGPFALPGPGPGALPDSAPTLNQAPLATSGQGPAPGPSPLAAADPDPPLNAQGGAAGFAAWDVGTVAAPVAGVASRLGKWLGGRGGGISRLIDDGVVRGFREVRKRQASEAITRGLASLGVARLLDQEAQTACAGLRETFAQQVLPALDNNLAQAAEGHARRATEIDLELQRLGRMRATSEALLHESREWLAQLAPVRSGAPADVGSSNPERSTP